MQAGNNECVTRIAMEFYLVVAVVRQADRRAEPSLAAGVVSMATASDGTRMMAADGAGWHRPSTGAALGVHGYHVTCAELHNNTSLRRATDRRHIAMRASFAANDSA